MMVVNINGHRQFDCSILDLSPARETSRARIDQAKHTSQRQRAFEFHLTAMQCQDGLLGLFTRWAGVDKLGLANGWAINLLPGTRMSHGRKATQAHRTSGPAGFANRLDDSYVGETFKT